MDEKRFDALVRARAGGASRRSVLKGLFGGIVGGAAVAAGAGRAFAEGETETATEPTPDPNLETATEPTSDPNLETTLAPELPTTAAPDTSEVEATTTAAPAGTDTTETEAEAASCTEGSIWCGWELRCVYGSCCPGETCNRCGTCVESTGTGGNYCVDPECCHGDKGDCKWCKDGYWDYKCHGDQECCPDYKDGTKDVCVDQCCYDDECREEYGHCFQCHLGTCFDICYDQGLFCRDSCNHIDSVDASDERWSPCVECCGDGDCYDLYGGCGYCDEWGKCKNSCEEGQICCLPGNEPAAGDRPAEGCAKECCRDSDCEDPCDYCNHEWGGVCKSSCDKGETCCDNVVDEWGRGYCSDHSDGCCGGPGDWCDEISATGEKLDGSCCYGLICSYDHKSKHGTCVQCEDKYDCPDGYGGYGYCCDGWCKAECCKDKDCDWGVCDGGVCKECASSDDCHKDEICCGGRCDHANCCSHDDCGDCELCLNGWCHQDPEHGAFGDSCEAPYLVEITSASRDYTPQFDCCDGLLCCEKQKHGLTGVCLECCDDHDCGKGCSCDYGACSCPTDKPDHPDHPDKPGKPGKPDEGDDVSTVDTLPATGTGSSQTSAGWIGAAALGAAAAYVAGKVISSTGDSEEKTAEG